MKPITSTLTLSLIRCHWLFHQIFNPGINPGIPGLQMDFVDITPISCWVISVASCDRSFSKLKLVKI